MTEKVAIQINGVRHEVAAGTSILKAAQAVGVHIPAFCWHKHLSVSGSCRMCLVEVKPGPSKPVIACATPVAEGMEVFTESEMTKQARRATLEFLLANHPLDCPVCDEAYECKLQDYTFAYGLAGSRYEQFHGEKRVFLRRRLGKLFVEMNRCIDCTRCVRYLKEVAGAYEIERYERGHRLKIDSYKDAFESPFALNAADLCPVGALEDAKFRFSARAWELVRTPSICPSCSLGCNVHVDAKDGQIKRLLPRENDEVNSCWMCDAGRWNFDFVNAEDRPLLARQGRGEAARELPSDAGVELAAKLLADFASANGAAAVALWLSPHMTVEELYLGKRLAREASLGLVGVCAGVNKRPLKAVNSDILPNTLVSDDKTPNSTGARLLGLPSGPGQAVELLLGIERGSIKGLVLFHENLAALQDLDAQRVSAALAKLQLLIVASYRPEALALPSDVFVPLTTFAEKSGSFVSGHPRWQRLRPAIAPRGGVPNEAELLCKLAASLGLEGYTSDDAALRAEIAFRESAFAEIDPTLIGDSGVALSLSGTPTREA